MPAVVDPLLAVTSGGTGGNAPQGNGWLYDLLTKAGLDPSTAHTVTELVVRPLEVLVVVLAAILAAHFGAKALRRVLLGVGHPAADRMRSPRASGRLQTVVALVANIWRFVVLLIAVGVLLTMFGINLTPLLASATIIGATVGFGAQALVRDYLSGVLLTVEDQFGIGDAISVNDTEGVVEDLSLRVTRVRGGDGTLWNLPNGDIRRLGNTSRGWVQAVVDLPVVVHGGEDLDRSRHLFLVTATSVTSEPPLSDLCPDPPKLAGMVEATEGTCTLRVTIRTASAQRSNVEYAVREALVRSLMDAGLWPPPSAGA